MRTRKSGGAITAFIVIFLILGLVLLGGGVLAVNHFAAETEAYRQSNAEADAVFLAYLPQPFINSAAHATFYIPDVPRDDGALFYFMTPKGFPIISHSAYWDEHMLELLYQELLLNIHGDEIYMLYNIAIFPEEQEVHNILAAYTQSITAVSLFFQFPAFPDDFSIDFPQRVGRISLYGGDTNTTIESMAGSLSHEYGHHFTFFYMLIPEMNENDSFADTTYAILREASRHDLITSSTPGDAYFQERHRYLFEVAAEDYVQFMGSPNTREVVDFFDVQQRLNGAESPEGRVMARNAFPQENMMLPLANDVPGLESYFFSFIDAEPRVPVEPRQDIALQIRSNSVEHHLVSGLRTFTHYIITWNTPYENAIYTLVSYDPHDYSGWGHPIKTVRPGQTASAVIGEYVVVRGDQVVFMDDGIAEGTRVFYVVALLPDGTFYISNKLEFQF